MFIYFFITEKDPVIKLGNLKVTDSDAFSIQKYKNLNTSFRNLKSLILLTYYDDDVNIQTCDEKLLSATLKGNLDYFLALSCNKMKNKTSYVSFAETSFYLVNKNKYTKTFCIEF